MAEGTKRAARTKYSVRRYHLTLPDGREAEVTLRVPADAVRQVRLSATESAVSISTSEGLDPLPVIAPRAITQIGAPASQRPPAAFVSSSTLREGEEESAEVSDGLDAVLVQKLADAKADGADDAELEAIVQQHNFETSAAGAGRAPRHDRSREIVRASKRLMQATVTDGTGQEIAVDLSDMKLTM